MGGCITKIAVYEDFEGRLTPRNKKVAWEKAPQVLKKAPVATIPCSNSSQPTSKVAACYKATAPATPTTENDASKLAPAQEAVSLVLCEEDPAVRSFDAFEAKTFVHEAVGVQVPDMSPGSLQEKPYPSQPKPTIREARCLEDVDDILSQLAVVEDRKQRLKAEKEHVSAAERAGIARQLNAGKKDKARLQRAMGRARAELALARVDRLPVLPEDFMDLRILGKGNWGEVVEVACCDSLGELHTYALKRALAPASGAAAPDAAPAGGRAAAAAATFRGASAKAAPEESGALDLPGAGRCIKDFSEEAAEEEAAEEVDPAGVEEVELLDTREAARHLTLMGRGFEARQALHTEGAFLSVVGPHPGIIGCIGWVGRDRSGLLLELARFGTLDSCLWGKQHRSRLRWTAAEKLRMSLQCVRAAMHIHAAGAVHRDIKPQNTLMVARTDARLADFGMACWASEAGRCRGLAGSAAYSINPLSVENFAAAGIQDDTWAIGLIIWCIHTRRDISAIQGMQMLAMERSDAGKADEQRIHARCRELGLPEGHYCYDLLVAHTLGLAGLDAPGMEDNPLTKPLPGEPKMPKEFTRMLRRATSVEAWRAQPVTLQEWERCLVSCLREAEEAEAEASMGCGIRWRF